MEEKTNKEQTNKERTNRFEIIFFRISIVVLILLIIAVIVIFTIKNNQNNQNNVDLFEQTYPKVFYEASINEEKLSQLQTEDVKIYIGKKGEFQTFDGMIYKNDSKEENAKSLISQVGHILGFNIIVKEVKTEKNGITVVLKNTSAPFDLVNTYVASEEELYHIDDVDSISDIILDSIVETLKQYFNENVTWVNEE